MQEGLPVDADAALLRALLHQADDLVLAADDRLRLCFVNRSVESALHTPAAALRGRTVLQAGLFGSAAAAVQAAMERTLRSGRRAELEVEWQRGAGTTRRYAVQLDVGPAAGPVGSGPASARGVMLLARDITESRRVENDLRLRERDFRTLAENSPDNIIRYGLDTRAVYCNREIEERVTVSAMRVVGRTPSEAAPPGMGGVAAYEQELIRTLATGERGTVELQVPHPNGEVRVHSVVFEAERDAAGVICGAVAVGRDVTESVRIRQSLAEKEREFRSLAENAGDNILRWDVHGRMLYANPEMARTLEMAPQTLRGKTPLDISPDGRFRAVYDAVASVAREGCPTMIELRLPASGGEGERVHEIRFFPERDEAGVVCSVLGIGRDITEKKAQLQLIESLVRTDTLTRLGNRQALQERAPALFAAAERRGGHVAVMLLDLDQFKSINDAMGHSAGDGLLRDVAHRLGACMRANDLLVRLGGDEFVLIAPDIDDVRAVTAIAGKVHAALAQPLSIGRREVRASASVGVAIYPNDGAGLEELLAHADSAMYQAKRRGRGLTEYYRSELSEAVRRRLVLEESMRDACDGRGLVLYFQPQVCLRSAGRVVGAEALLRWEHPTLGLLAPDTFIALAEETGMIVPIGRWVLESAARTAARWNRGRCEPLRVAVNVSTRQLVLDRLPEVVDAVLARTGCEPGWLSIEITESALLEDSPLVQQALEAFRARGLQVSIDDFGTGYSALNYLARFHVDCLKIDKSFVQAIERSSRDGELVKAFIAMAAALNLTTVAEGIETDAQAEFLLAHGCPIAQGYRFGRPIPAAQFERDLLGEIVAA